MELKIQALHFDATEKLQAFVEKKMQRFARRNAEVSKAEFTLRVVKPETSLNKKVSLNVFVPGDTLHAEKTCDTFEEGVAQVVEAVERALEKRKEKHR
ncbi:MAG: ribosome-associated translation inhibitor RaiA [Bacteroidaceae bacterium]|nr:ribosome-associated translation inhibitor RaiA [Bacteroidaceae bacterium]